MQQFLEHPTEEALERFLLHQCQEPEIEFVETHILACESCVERLEALEMQIAATKIALAEFQRDSRESARAKEKRHRKAWFRVGGLSFAGAAACVVLVLALFAPAQVDLAAHRGRETSSVPEGRPLHMHLETADVPDGSVTVQLVDGEGAEVWKGASTVSHERTDVHLPRLRKRGVYFLRLYTPAKGSAEGDLLREFPFRVN
jgi:anti-sigma factor RsiW